MNYNVDLVEKNYNRTRSESGFDYGKKYWSENNTRCDEMLSSQDLEGLVPLRPAEHVDVDDPHGDDRRADERRRRWAPCRWSRRPGDGARAPLGANAGIIEYKYKDSITRGIEQMTFGLFASACMAGRPSRPPAPPAPSRRAPRSRSRSSRRRPSTCSLRPAGTAVLLPHDALARSVLQPSRPRRAPAS